MLWVFAALACHPDDGEPNTNDHLVGSGDDTATATDVDDDTATEEGDDTATEKGDDTATDVDSGTEEICGNGLDDNGNGTADGCDWSGELALEGTKLTTTDYAAGMGSTLAICDVNGDGVGDVVTGAPGYEYPTGAVYVFYGPILDDRDAKDADYALMGTDRDSFVSGATVDCRRDFDGDGVADIIVGEFGPGPPSAPGDHGTVYVVPGGGAGRVPIADEASSTWRGSLPGDRLGFEVVAIDVDGDATDELAAAISLTYQGPHRYGIAYLFEDMGAGERHADAAAAAYFYGEAGDRLEDRVGNAGDLDGDGLEELAISGTDEASAELLLFRDPLVGAIPKAAADVRIVGGSRDSVGWTAIGHADLDADGREDLFLGDSTYDVYDGAVYVFFAPIEGPHEVATADVRILGTPDVMDRVGWDATSPGDVDGDGIGDLLIGAVSGETVYLQYGGDRGSFDLDKTAQAWWTSKGASAGSAVAAGDVTGDGIVDFLIGSAGDGANYQGSVTIVPSWQL